MSEGAEDMERKSAERSSSLGPGNASPSRIRGGNGKSRGGKTNRRENGYQNQKQQFRGPVSKSTQGSSKPGLRYGTVPDKKPQSRRQMGRPVDLLKDELDMYSDFTGSTSPKSNKKQPSSVSLNHLLNFTYEPRQNDVMSSRPSRKTKFTPFNKEQFLQANCQFIVRETGNYVVHTVDSDMLVNWDLIEQVRIFSHDVPSCPICLFPPTAAKITRCGHIYCWSCVLHYLSLTKNSWQKCPICFEAVHSKDLKSVVSMMTHRYTRGEKITLRLMQRVKGSVIAVPKSQWSDRKGEPYNISECDVDTCFVKLLVASTEDILNKVIKKEEEILKQQLKEVKSERSGEQPFVEMALAMVQKRETELMQDIQNENGINIMLQGVKVTEDEEEFSDSKESTIVSTWRTLSPNSFESTDDYEAAFSDEESEQIKGIDMSEKEENPEAIINEFKSVLKEDAQVTPSIEDGDGTDTMFFGTREAKMLDSDEESSRRTLSTSTEASDGIPANVMTGDVIETVQIGTEEDDKDESDMICGTDAPQSDPGEPQELLAYAESDNGFSRTKESDVGIVTNSSGPDCYYFYQADDGQNIFLHPINARCLTKEYGSLENSPEFITGTVIEMEAFSQTQVVRKRYRYLSHLPLTCEFMVCELDLRPPLLSKGTLHEFRDILRYRKWQRQKKAKEERKRERRLSGNEYKPAMRLSLSSDRDFPKHSNVECFPSSESFPSPAADQPSSSESSCNSSIASSPPASFTALDEIGGGSPEGMPSVPSFAQALLSKKVNVPEQYASVSKKVEKGVSGEKREGNESDHEDYVPVPTFQTAFSAALLAADWDIPRSGSKQGGGKKQKKAKKKLLFSTSTFPKYA